LRSAALATVSTVLGTARPKTAPADQLSRRTCLDSLNPLQHLTSSLSRLGRRWLRASQLLDTLPSLRFRARRPFHSARSRTCPLGHP
jgi:hypothetical protein